MSGELPIEFGGSSQAFKTELFPKGWLKSEPGKVIGKFFYALWILKRKSGRSGDFAQSAIGSANDGAPASHGLDHGHTKALEERREYERFSRAIKRGQILVWHETKAMDVVGPWGLADHGVDNP